MIPALLQDFKVFQEDEIILILAGGVLGVVAGLVQLFFGWGGPTAIPGGMSSLSGL